MVKLPRFSMPVGVSANSMGLNDDPGYNWRVVIKLFVIFGAVVALGAGIWLGVKNASPLGSKQLTNGGFTYHMSYYKEATLGVVGTAAALTSGQSSYAVAKPTLDAYVSECAQRGSRWVKAMEVIIDDTVRPVCTQDNLVYYTNFYALEQNHSFEVSFIAKQYDAKLVKKIMQSITITK